MKRTFSDLHLCLNPTEPSVAHQTLSKAATLGYGLVSVPFPTNTQDTIMSGFRDICNRIQIEFASRVDLQPKTRDQLMRMLRNLRRKFEVVCVICNNKEVARQAAKDRRVDLLSFPFPSFREKSFDWAEAELASSSLSSLEIDVKPLLLSEGTTRVRLLSSLRLEVSIAREFHVPIVVSSGASNSFLLRKPRELAAFVSMLGLDEPSALKAISYNPESIVLRNREKLSSGFVAPGIRVVKEGRDC